MSENKAFDLLQMKSLTKAVYLFLVESVKLRTPAILIAAGSFGAEFFRCKILPEYPK